MAAIRDVGFEILDHSPYSADLRPTIFKVKEYLKRQTFEDIEAVVATLKKFLGLFLDRDEIETGSGRALALRDVTEEQWQCRDGSCIRADAKCNGTRTCADGSDETHALCRSITSVQAFTAQNTHNN
ncbi:Low-density lipoprotein receptor-related protein 2 [Eumeta japonica]|uniref:Low-density lipoprotein receptor-related protein 2 n=1 Tax=Eumeta variegata TaxID=151549 RepID=A0A4C1VDD5_EUMVA|nr:Low-density lipoprotein receptor-related protein 2 [Eumeta japonica]